MGQGLEERGSTFGSSNSYYVNVNYPIVSDATRIDPVSLSLSPPQVSRSRLLVARADLALAE